MPSSNKKDDGERRREILAQLRNNEQKHKRAGYKSVFTDEKFADALNKGVAEEDNDKKPE